MDMLPLTIAATEWDAIERAVIQRVTLLNLVLRDLTVRSACCRWPAAAGTGLRQSGLPARLLRHRAARQRLPARTTRSISRERRMARGGCSPIARRRRLVWATRSRTVSSARARCRRCSTGVACDRSRASSTRRSKRCSSWHHLTCPTPRRRVDLGSTHNETCFEHSFLSKHWGVPVGGDDLTVREPRLPQDARRSQSRARDRSGAWTTISATRWNCGRLAARHPGPGARGARSNIFIANSLGERTRRNTVGDGVSARLARHLMGETLQLPSVATWWCGQAGPRQRVLEPRTSGDQADVSALWQSRRVPGADVGAGTATARSSHRRAHPNATWRRSKSICRRRPIHTSRCRARHVVLRVPAAWDGAGYAVLPGGLHASQRVRNHRRLDAERWRQQGHLGHWRFGVAA